MSRLAEQMARFESAPYVYSYPTTRMYKAIENFFSPESANFTKEINLYIHIPFCKQKCTFCGYLTAIQRSNGSLQEEYVEALVREISMYKEILQCKVVKTVNFGGGTPSLLTASQFESIMDALIEANPNLLNTATEISIEATPESVELEKFRRFSYFGLNRVSVGIESFSADEIKYSKRNNLQDVSADAVQILHEIGIPNVCCDLMYGLEGQDLDSWMKSVMRLISLRPETIELYSTVVIPGTPMANRNAPRMTDRERYDCYSHARFALTNCNYIQDCHLRFILAARGAYKQQENVFGGQSLIGFGAGARSYGDNVHYRNNFNGGNGLSAIREYIAQINSGKLPIQSAANLSEGEKIYRYIIYNLEHLNTTDFKDKFGLCIELIFGGLLRELTKLELLQRRNDRFVMLPKGFYFRDLIAKQFFSKAVLEAESEYYGR